MLESLLPTITPFEGSNVGGLNAKMQPPLDTYQHPSKSSTRRLPDITEVPGQEEYDDVSCTCHTLTEHTRLQNSKCTSSRELNRTSLMSQRHSKALDVNHIRTHARGASYFILTFAVVVVVFMLMSAMAYIVVSFSSTQSHLLERVTSLEHRLAELDSKCECGRASDGGSGQNEVINGERRHNKFAFLMAHGHAKLLEGEVESKPEEDFDLHHEVKETPDTGTPGIHPKVLIKLEEARSTAPSPQVQNPASRDSAPLDEKSASPKWMPATPHHIVDAGRYKRGAKRKGKDQRRQPEDLQRGRASPQTVHPGHNSTRVRGVHFQANLNRTTTIGVGEAGWVPYWALSSSLLRVGSPEFTEEIKSEFRLSARGNVTVRTEGLYYVYSQMMYYDPNEYIGHSIVVDGVEAFTCIAPISGQTNKYKTCFIGGLVYIPSRGKVGIKMLYTPRRVCLFEDTSYFGMFRVT